jgi:hypothetical protein
MSAQAVASRVELIGPSMLTIWVALEELDVDGIAVDEVVVALWGIATAWRHRKLHNTTVEKNAAPGLGLRAMLVLL